MTSDTMQRVTTKAKEYFANKVAFSTGPMEISYQMEQGEDLTLIDVRDEEDFEKGHLPGAIHVPEAQWKTPLGLRKNAMNIVYCYSQTCHRAAKVAMEFADQGYPVMEMDGGFEAWKENKLKVEK